MVAKMQVHPKELADAFKSVLEFTKDDKGNPDVMVDYNEGVLSIVGVGRYNAARQTVAVEPGDGSVDSTVLVQGRRKGKSDEVDDLVKLASSVTPSTATGISSAKGNRVTVEIEDGARLTILDGQRLVGELPDSGNGATMHEWLENNLATRAWGPTSGPLALSIDTASRLSKIKSDSPVVDLAVTGSGNMARLQCGTRFMGLVTTIDRELFAKGGPWGAGPGSPEKLLV